MAVSTLSLMYMICRFAALRVTLGPVPISFKCVGAFSDVSEQTHSITFDSRLAGGASVGFAHAQLRRNFPSFQQRVGSRNRISSVVLDSRAPEAGEKSPGHLRQPRASVFS